MLEIRGSRVGGKVWWMAKRHKGSREEVPAREEQTEAPSRCGEGGIGGSGTYLSAAKEHAGSQGRNVSMDRLSGSLGRSWSVGQAGQDAIAGRGAVAGSRVGGQCNAAAAPEFRTA